MTAAPTTLVFVDVETTGLGAGFHEVWEVAAIVRDHARPDFDGEHHWFLNVNHMERADPAALTIGKFHARYRRSQATSRAEFRHAFLTLVTGAVWVGCNPSFDVNHLAPLLEVSPSQPPWHYRTVCAEALAAGFISSGACAMSSGMVRVPVPWSNHKDLAPALCIAPDPDEHSALADARYAAELYDAVML